MAWTFIGRVSPVAGQTNDADGALALATLRESASIGDTLIKFLEQSEAAVYAVFDPTSGLLLASTDAADWQAYQDAIGSASYWIRLKPDAGQDGRALTWSIDAQGSWNDRAATIDAHIDAQKPRRTVNALINRLVPQWFQTPLVMLLNQAAGTIEFRSYGIAPSTELAAVAQTGEDAIALKFVQPPLMFTYEPFPLGDPPADLLSNLLAHWPLESDGNDDSGAGMHLSEVDSPQYVSGKLSNAGETGTNGSAWYADGAVFDPTNGYTLAGWVYLPTVQACQIAGWEGTGGLYIACNGAGVVYAAHYAGNNDWQVIEHNTGQPTEAWFHVALRWTPGGKVTFSVNGVSQDTPANVAALVCSNQELWIGRASWGYQSDGLFDDFAFWARRLSDDDLAAHFANGAGLPFAQW